MTANLPPQTIGFGVQCNKFAILNSITLLLLEDIAKCVSIQAADANAQQEPQSPNTILLLIRVSSLLSFFYQLHNTLE